MARKEASKLAGNAAAEGSKVFISYANCDKEFVDILAAALAERGITPFIDRTHLDVGFEWWDSIQHLIVRSDALVFVVSPDSIASEYCGKEIEYADGLNKRLVPIIRHKPTNQPVPEALARIHYVNFVGKENADAEVSFTNALKDLVNTLNSDIDWIRVHTRLTDRALVWLAAGRPKHRAVRGVELAEAKHWLRAKPKGAPEPTDLHFEYIDASIRAATLRRRLINGGVAFTLFVGVLGAAIVLVLWQINLAQRSAALTQESYRLTDIARQHIRRGDAVTGMLLALEALPDETRGLERPYVADAEDSLILGWNSIRERLVLAEESALIRIVEFSPDGSRVLTASRVTTPRIWDARTGAALFSLVGRDKGVRNAIFSPAGNQVATRDASRNVTLWDARTGDRLDVLQGHKARVIGLAYSPEGRWLASISGDTTRLWDASTGNAVDVFDNPVRVSAVSFGPGPLGFGPDGPLVVTKLGDGKSRIWKPQVGVFVPLLGDGIDLACAVFNPGGTRLLTCAWQQARLWDTTTGREVLVLEGHKGTVTSAAFSPDGERIATVGQDQTARLWNARTGEPIVITSALGLVDSLRGHSHGVVDVAFSPDGARIATTSLDDTARIWDVSRVIRIVRYFWSDGRKGTASFQFTDYGINPFRRQFESTQGFLEFSRQAVPRCLTGNQRKEFLVVAAPPRWCVAMGKWPYHTSAWKQWLTDTDAGANPPIPESQQ